MYIVMDGFDLGIGILFPVTRDGHDRDVMVNSVAPVWDPMPRSNPSITIYIGVAKTIMTNQINGRSIPIIYPHQPEDVHLPLKADVPECPAWRFHRAAAALW